MKWETLRPAPWLTTVVGRRVFFEAFTWLGCKHSGMPQPSPLLLVQFFSTLLWMPPTLHPSIPLLAFLHSFYFCLHLFASYLHSFMPLPCSNTAFLLPSAPANVSLHTLMALSDSNIGDGSAVWKFCASPCFPSGSCVPGSGRDKFFSSVFQQCSWASKGWHLAPWI